MGDDVGVTAKWFTVRCVFRLGSLEEIEDAEPHIYEERLTLWQADLDAFFDTGTERQQRA